MAGTVTTYVQPMTQPLEGLHSSFTNLASQHRDINKQLRNHADDLLTGSGLNFQGAGAQAFSGLVNYYLDTSEKHMKTFDDAAGAVQTCHATITTASANADGAGLHPGLTNHVLSQVSHNDIIQRGSEPIWAVVNDMMKTLGDMAHQGGSFLGDVFTGNFSGAWDALKKEWGDLGNLGSDAMSLVQDIGHVLGSWADTVWNAIKTVGSFLGTVLWDVADFVLGISSIINDVKVLFDPHKSIWDKLLAAGDLALNVGMDVSMLFGVGEALKGGELLVKGGIDLGEKFMEDGGENVVKKEFEELTDKGAEDLAGQPVKDPIKDPVKEPVKEPVKSGGGGDGGGGGGGGGDPKVPYSRVQGGTPPRNLSRRLISVNEDGSIRIPNKGTDLNVSVGDQHAEYFMQKRGGDAHVVKFDLPKWLHDMIMDDAVPQYGYRSNPARGMAPKIVDPTTPGLSLEFPKNSPWLEWIEEYATNGRVIGPK